MLDETRTGGPGTATIGCRSWAPQDDEALRALMCRQMDLDPAWPPGYARGLDPAQWLGASSDLGRWVAVDDKGALVGHVGLAAVRPGPAADHWCAALACECDRLAEICRMVVDPQARLHGIASRLTRRAMRSAIEAGRVPVATVLVHRTSWLRMMLDTGWRRVGTTVSSLAQSELYVLAPPQRFVDLALGRNER